MMRMDHISAVSPYTVGHRITEGGLHLSVLVTCPPGCSSPASDLRAREVRSSWPLKQQPSQDCAMAKEVLA